MEDELKEAVLLVFANKQDLPNALSVGEITEKLGLNQYRNKAVSIPPSPDSLLRSSLQSLAWRPELTPSML